jgi:hypothetical protein
VKNNQHIMNIIFTLVIMTVTTPVFAETIWCKAFKAGCITEEQKMKHQQYCDQMGNQSYVESLNKALADPTVWQYAGKKSAQDYAQMSKSGMVATCFKMSNPQSF